MKLHFESDLDFQRDAIDAVADLFEGQSTGDSPFSVRLADENALPGFAVAGGTANELRLNESALESNAWKVQKRNGLLCSDPATVRSRQFSIEMETGTGKTYVYLRTVFELNKRYGWTKFIVVVPSIAIREGVSSSIRSMTDHFRSLYNNVPFDHFVYDSGKLDRVRDFALSNTVKIMVVTIDAMNKDSNLFNRYNDKMLGVPREFVRQCRPIVVLDEPQSIDNTETARQTLSALDPLFTLRYSATHRKGQEYCMLYRLDSVDAYRKKLVKELFVASVSSHGNYNRPYVALKGVSATRSKLTATIEIDCKQARGWKRKAVKVDASGGTKSDLEQLSGGADKYVGYVVTAIDATPGSESVTFRNQTTPLPLNHAWGEGGGAGMDESLVRKQIGTTIREHLDKSLNLRPKGIKVLSLFFLDQVRDYRAEDDGPHAATGRVATIFEEEYARLLKEPKYDTLFKEIDRDRAPREVHDGYFSIDKHGKSVNTDEGNQTGRENAERGYDLIMKDKEKLLSFDSKVEFIFSHSALKEGWDNPNVFQICALGHIASGMRRRQMIGRGLRICVNQQGERVRDPGLNALTVFADEDFSSFAAGLQAEIEKDTGVRFGWLSDQSFAELPVDAADGKTERFGEARSAALFEFLAAANLLDAPDGNGWRKMKEELREAAVKGVLALPDDLQPFKAPIVGYLQKLTAKINVHKTDDRVAVKLVKERFLSPDFKELWEQIRRRTTYRVDYDAEKLKNECTEAVKRMPAVEAPQYKFEKRAVEIHEGGITDNLVQTVNEGTDGEGIVMPDVVARLQNETKLTRATLVAILRDSGRLGDFKRNPETFIQLVVDVIRAKMEKFIVDGVKYVCLGEASAWAQELFEEKEISALLTNVVDTPNHGLYDKAVIDSPVVEREFAQGLEAAANVKLFVKLPDWFKIPTPLGGYNPDWAVLVEEAGRKRLYFVVETKGTQLLDELSDSEKAKIKCGMAHFAAVIRDAGSKVVPLLNPPVHKIDDFQTRVSTAAKA